MAANPTQSVSTNDFKIHLHYIHVTERLAPKSLHISCCVSSDVCLQYRPIVSDDTVTHSNT